MAISLEKEIRHGAFLAGLNGKKFWVDLKYEQLPVLCHYCGLLGQIGRASCRERVLNLV